MAQRIARPAVQRLQQQQRQNSMATTIPTVSWRAPEAARMIRDAVVSSTFLLVEHVLSTAQCHLITERVRQYGPAQMLVPFVGENIVSFARNEWTDETIPVASLCDENRTSHGPVPPGRLQTRLALDGIFDHRTDLPNHQHHNNHHPPRAAAAVVETLLGGHDLNEEASMVFVTAAGLRTPLHSDERHGLLLHVHGVKNYFVIPAAISDTHSPESLRQLLTLRDTSGTHRDLYQSPPREEEEEDRPPQPASVPPAALTKIINRCYRGTLPPGSALFLPQRNLHDMESVSPTISISLRFGRWDEPNNDDVVEY
jgi:hypothetical protein